MTKDSRPPNKAQKVYWRVLCDRLALATMPSTEEEMTRALAAKRRDLRRAQREQNRRVEIPIENWNEHCDRTLVELLRYRSLPLPSELGRSTKPDLFEWDNESESA